MVKSEEEIAVTRVGAEAADVGGEACRAALVEGVTEWEVGLQVVNAMTKYMATALDDRAEMMDSWAWIQVSCLNRSYCVTIVYTAPVRHQHGQRPQPAHQEEDQAGGHRAGQLFPGVDAR